MVRRIIEINEEKCNGCGACAAACHEGAIGMVDGKAKLLRDDYCDGLGDCLPTCPTNAISFVEREAAAYDEAAVQAAKKGSCPSGGCPGSAPKVLQPKKEEAAPVSRVSRLENWPVQIKLLPIRAPWLDGKKLLVAADCTAYAYAAFHEDFIKDHAVIVGCPKLDGVDYSIKLTEIIKENDIRSVTVARMEVPCCGGLEFAVKKALQQSGKLLPWSVVTIGVEGNIVDRT